MTQHPPRIRLMEPHDLAPVLRLIGLVPQAPSWSVEDFRKLILVPDCDLTGEALLTRAAWVAEANALLLGLIVVQCLRTPGQGGEDGEIECELESILVHPEARRAGLGRQLLATAIAWSMQQKASALRLEVRIGNQPAIHLYERAGFMQTGRRPHYYSNPEEDALLMQINLSPRGLSAAV